MVQGAILQTALPASPHSAHGGAAGVGHATGARSRAPELAATFTFLRGGERVAMAATRVESSPRALGAPPPLSVRRGVRRPAVRQRTAGRGGHARRVVFAATMPRECFEEPPHGAHLLDRGNEHSQTCASWCSSFDGHVCAMAGRALIVVVHVAHVEPFVLRSVQTSQRPVLTARALVGIWPPIPECLSRGLQFDAVAFQRRVIVLTGDDDEPVGIST